MIPIDLSIPALSAGYSHGFYSLPEVIEEVRRRIALRGQDGVWIYCLSPEELDPYIRRAQTAKAQGYPQPLFGIPFAIKDNIDLAGIPTTAGCAEFAYTPSVSSAAVQQLLEAGAIPIGKTNMDQFATGLVGTRTPFGIPSSVFDSRYLSGGSSSGSAIAVAADLVSFSLGTDTAGSGRVPAAFNHLIGLKPTRGRISARGVVPACRSLDCLSVFTKEIQGAAKVLSVIDGKDPLDPWSRSDKPLSSLPIPPRFRFGVLRADQEEFFGDEAAQTLYQKSIQDVTSLGGSPVSFDYTPFLEVARLLYSGPWVAERLAAIEPFYREHSGHLHPVVRQILAQADQLNAVETFRGFYRLQELKRQIEPLWQEIDVLLLPTTGTTYRIEEVLADPIRLNTNLGYYTNFVNLLDLCAMALPAGFRPNGLPFGISLLATSFRDEELLALGQRFLTTSSLKT